MSASWAAVSMILLSSAAQDSLDAELAWLHAEIDSLLGEREALEIQLASLNSVIDSLTTARLSLLAGTRVEADLVVALTREGKLRERPMVVSDVIGTIPAGTEVSVVGYEEGYFEVRLGTKSGFLNSMYLPSNGRLFDMVKRERQATRAESDARKRQRILDKYGSAIGGQILAKRIWIGMTDEMAQDAIGRPSSVNRTTVPGLVSEQWVYANRYLYFDNGVLTSWQDVDVR